MSTTNASLQLEEQPQEINGWKAEDLDATVQALQEQPEAAELTWCARVDWDAGFGVDARITEIEQLGQVLRRSFTLRGDHPPELLGHNTGPTAVETLMAALGSCIAGTFALHAAARGVRVDAIEVELESNIDLHGFLQLAPVDAGIRGTRATVRVRSDADDETLRELLETTHRASPVFDSVTRPVHVATAVERLR